MPLRWRKESTGHRLALWKHVTINAVLPPFDRIVDASFGRLVKPFRSGLSGRGLLFEYLVPNFV